MYLLMSVVGPLLLGGALLWVSTHNRRPRTQRETEDAKPPISSRTFLTIAIGALGLFVIGIGVFELVTM